MPRNNSEERREKRRHTSYTAKVLREQALRRIADDDEGRRCDLCCLTKRECERLYAQQVFEHFFSPMTIEEQYDLERAIEELSLTILIKETHAQA